MNEPNQKAEPAAVEGDEALKFNWYFDPALPIQERALREVREAIRLADVGPLRRMELLKILDAALRSRLASPTKRLPDNVLAAAVEQAIRCSNRHCGEAVPAREVPPVEMSPEFTDSARGALLWVLWHHQGGSSPVGQPLRYALGMGRFDDLSAEQIAEAKRWDALMSHTARTKAAVPTDAAQDAAQGEPK